jgi:clan AA aspartic protease (TIGR02281 family)
MKYLISFILSFIIPMTSFCQDRIKLEKNAGVFYLVCKVNGVAMKFVLDSGASEVSISITEAMFLFKNGYLDASSIVGEKNYTDASGNIVKGTTIILKTFQIGNLVLKNIKANVVDNENAPLLLGQSALSQLGRYSIDYETSELILDKYSTNNLSSKEFWWKNEIERMKVKRDIDIYIFKYLNTNVVEATKLLKLQGFKFDSDSNGDMHLIRDVYNKSYEGATVYYGTDEYYLKYGNNIKIQSIYFFPSDEWVYTSLWNSFNTKYKRYEAKILTEVGKNPCTGFIYDSVEIANKYYTVKFREFSTGKVDENDREIVMYGIQVYLQEPKFSDKEIPEFADLKVKGSYRIKTIAKFLEIDEQLLIRLNPNFDKEIQNASKPIQLRIPIYKLEQFIILKDKIQLESKN